MKRQGSLRRIRYKPPKTIARFMASPAFYRGLLGPVGSGKSSACCMEIFTRACGQAADAAGVRRSRFAILRNTYRELRDTTLRTWLDWFPEGAFGSLSRADLTYRLRVPLVDGTRVESELLFRALDRPQDARRLLSLELTGAWINEARELPLCIVEALGDRVERYPSRREGGCTWAGVFMDTNPPDMDHWWRELAEDKKPAGWAFFNQPGGLVERGGAFFPNPGAENIANLPPRFYERRMAGKTPAHVRVYYCAQYGFAQDGMPVYPEFDPNRHIAGRELVPVPGSPLFAGLDFGLTPAAAIGQRLADGRWLILDELVSVDMGMVRFSGLLKELLAARYPGFRPEIWGDPAGATRAQTDERTPFDILRAGGLSARPTPSNDPLLRREAVAAALSREVDGRPGLLLSPRCRTLIAGMAGAWRYRRLLVAGEARYDNSPEKSRFSHVCEAAQYMLAGAGEGRRLLAPAAGPAAPPRQTRTRNDFRTDPLASRPSPQRRRS